MIDARQWGLDVGYEDAMGAWREAPASTVTAILAAMGAQEGHGPYASGSVLTVRLDHELPPVPPGQLTLEDGSTLDVGGQLPPGLPTGYHHLDSDDAEPGRLLIVSPGQCPLPPAAHSWGWAAQLYAARSQRSWGVGDLGDLRQLAEWSSSLGASMALINPLHAPPPGDSPEPSPYFASSRCFTSPLYLRIEELPGAGDIVGLDRLVAQGRALNVDRRIDRSRVWALKSSALEQLFSRFTGDPGFERFRAERGDALAGFATYGALAERFGSSWREWPARYRRPDSEAVRLFAGSEAGRRRVRFHAWMQWHLDQQLAVAAGPVGLMPDLAIGVNAGGADSWLWQDTFAEAMRVGAPPDEFNTLGQDWGLPPWDPWKLRAANYEPYIQTIRAGLRHAGGLRFDHVMGLFRLFWIPEGQPARDGTYVRYPYWDLLNILALEAERAGAYVVGEDLGTVEDHVRRELAERRVLSYRLLWFEPGPPETWPSQALGAVTTHDLPTIAGVWTGTDLAAQHRLGMAPNEEGALGMRARLAELTGCGAASPMSEVIEQSYSVLARSPCAVLTATLEDAVGVEERPNMPGTTDEWPNWSMALPQTLDELEESPLARSIAARLARPTTMP